MLGNLLLKTTNLIRVQLLHIKKKNPRKRKGICYELLAWPAANPFILFLGWGDEITWVQTYEEGLYQAKKR